MMITYLFSFLLLAEGRIIYPNDTVEKVPGWGEKYTGAMYSGYVPIDQACNSAIFYWMLEKEGGSNQKTPVLLWLNGGPGASSITGLLSENIGPYQITGDSFTFNEHAWTNKYNVLVIDNPVGTGYSLTDNRTECYAQNESEVAANFYVALDIFFNKLHPEYAKNPFFLTGESYAGKYIPHIAAYLHQMNFPFDGVIIGNGLYEPTVQYPTVPKIAWNFGVIDKRAYFAMLDVAQECVQLILDHDYVTAGVFCEEMVSTIYDGYGEGVFRYDLRVYYDVFANLGEELSTFLNSAEVKSALHTTGATWTDSDETGPVADALRGDFVLSVIPQLEILVQAGYQVILYNGQMDGSVCNHVGNTLIMDDIEWSGNAEFSALNQTLWKLSDENVIGYRKVYKNLAYVIIANAGHLVPMNQPENFRVFLDTAVGGHL